MCARSRLSCEVVRLRGDREALDIVIAARDATLARVEALQVEWSHRGETVRSSRELAAALKGDS